MADTAGTGLLAGVAHEHLLGVVAALLTPLVIVLVLRVVRASAGAGAAWATSWLGRLAAAPPTTRRCAWLLVLAGTIHLGLVPGHWSNERATALLFLLNGLLYCGLGTCAVLLRRWRVMAATLLASTLLAYLLYLASGREDPDQLGLATALLELATLGLVLAPAPRGGRSVPGWRWFGMAGVLFALTMLTGVVAWAASFRPDSTAGSTTASHAGMVMQPTPATATPKQRAAAAQLVASTRAGIARYADVRRALADGYRPSTAPLAPTVHYLNPRLVAAGRSLDPDHPQALVYATTPRGPELLGAMFMLPRPGLVGPDIGGPLTVWHVHTNICFGSGAAIVGFTSPFGLCPAGSINVTTPAMLHVWVVPNPNGPFGDLDDAWVARFVASR